MRSGKKVFNCLFLSWRIRILEWVYTLLLPECQVALCWKQAQYLTCKLLQTFSCKSWTSTRLEGRIIGKTLTLPKHEDIIINSMTQTREKWNSLALSRTDFWMVWRCHGIPYFHFNFLFSTNGKKEHLDENDFHHGYGKYFESAILKVTWYQQEH